MGYKQSRRRRYNNNSNSHWYDEAVYTLQVYYRPQPWLQVLRFIYPIIRFALLYIKCLVYGITYVVGSTMSSVILLRYASALAFAIAFIFYIVYLRHMIAFIKQEVIEVSSKIYYPTNTDMIRMPINGGTDDSTSEEMAAEEKSASHTQDVQALSSDNDQRVSSDHPTQDVQTTPTSIIDDLSIPGAFAQHSQCSNKRCCNDTGCSNYRDIGEYTYVYFRRLACLLIYLPFSLILWYR